MSLKINAKKRITQLLIALVVVALTATGSVVLFSNLVPEAKAAVEYPVVDTASWNTAVGDTSGQEIIIRLDKDLSFGNDTTHLTIPSGKKVTLNMNGHTISRFSQVSDSGTHMTTSYPAKDDYWGLIVNNGDLTIEGGSPAKGVISQILICNSYENGSDKDNWVSKAAAIVNNGTLDIKLGITVENIFGQENTDGNNKQDMFIYSHAVFNQSGTVTTNGTLHAGAYAQGVNDSGTGSESKASAFAYGIFGGTVNVTGGNIYSEAMSGAQKTGTTYKTKTHVWNYAVGVYSNAASITGNTKIETKATSWGGSGSANMWKEASNMSWGIGVMYSDTGKNGANAPVIGPDVNISASYYQVTSDDGKETVSFPTMNNKSAYISGATRSSGSPDSYGRQAYAVAGISVNENAAMYGAQSGETNSNSSSVFGAGTSDKPATSYYRTELQSVFNDSLSSSSNNHTSSTSNGRELKTSYIKMGGSGETGGQYMVIYRYRDINDKITKVSKTPDTEINSRMIFSPETGMFTTDQAVLSKKSGGTVVNPNYYTLVGTYFKAYGDAQYGEGVDCAYPNSTMASTSGQPFDSFGMSANNSYLIFVDYKALRPSYIEVYASDNKGNPNKEFEVTYTGSEIVPGVDFKFGVLDMGSDSSYYEGNSENYNFVTDSYAIKNVDETGKLTLRYSYKDYIENDPDAENADTYTNSGLPKNAGKYRIKIVVPDDTVGGKNNRYGGTFYLTCTIKKATPTLSGPTTKSGVYGSTVADLIPTDSYTITGNGEAMTGTWSYGSYAGTDVPGVGNGSLAVNLKWTPSGDCAANYNAVSTTVTVAMAKRVVTVTPANSTVVYGQSTPAYNVTFTYNGSETGAIPACDSTKVAGWLANTVFKVSKAGANEWAPYASTLVPNAGGYDLKIDEETGFGGDTANYDFRIGGTSKLTINKAPLNYTAKATNKDYDGNTTVDVTLTYKSGAVNGDNYAATLTTTGTVANANAAKDKTVTVNTNIDFVNDEKYYIAVESPTVTINQATPEVTPDSYSYSYDVNRTLADISLSGTSNVAGSWNWLEPTTNPTVGKSTYKAEFRPADSTNYKTVTVDVTVNISKAKVIVGTGDKTVTFGNAVELPLVYTFPDGNKIENIVTTGTVSPKTAYVRGSVVGTYPVTIEMTDYEADNYYFEAKSSVIAVEKKEIAVTAPSKTVVYGDTVPEFLVSELKVADDALYGSDTLASLASEAQFSIITDYSVGSSVGGTYRVTVNANETQNYRFTSVDGYVTVEKATLKVIADNKTATFNDSTPTLSWTYSGYRVEGDTAPTGTVVITTKYSKGSDAGTYAITIKNKDLTHNNYKFEFVDGVLTVNKLTVNTTGLTISADIVHDELYSEAEFGTNSLTANGLTIPGTFALKEQNAKADYTKATGVVLGKKYIDVKGIFNPTNSDNYNSVEVDVRLFIATHEITGAPVIKGTAMEGSTLTANVAGMTPADASKYDFSWTINGSVVSTASTYTVGAGYEDKTILLTVTAKEDLGYKGSKTATVVVVEKFSKLADDKNLYDFTGLDTDTWTKTYTYNGNSFAVEVAVKDEYKGLVSDNITVYYNGTTSEPSKVGTYIVTIDVGVPAVADESQRDKYYGPVSGLEIGKIIIEKAEIIATFAVADKIYDGTRKVESYNVTKNEAFENDSVYLDASALSITFARANAGQQSVEISGIKLTGEDAGNYKLVIPAVTATIEPRTLKVTAEGVKREYNGSVQVDVTFVVDASTYAPVDSASTIYFVRATANATSPNYGTQGITDIRYELGGTSKDNYVVAITNLGSAEVFIDKATPSVVAPVINGLVYDTQRTLASIKLTDYYVKDDNGFWMFDDTSIVPTVRKTAYAATYVSNNENYKDYNTSITVNIIPKEVTLTAENVSVSYGKAASYSVKADGFCIGDSLATMGGTQPTFECVYYVGCSVKEGGYNISILHNLDSHGNYTFKTVDGTLTVVPAELYVTATATNRDYNGTTGVEVKFDITSGKFENDDVALSVSTANGVASSANAGTRTVTYTAPTLTGSKASNYKLTLSPASGILSVTINKLNPEGYVFPASATIPFGYALSWAEFSDDAQGDGTFAFSDKNEIPDSIGDNYMFEVVFTPTDSVNYNTVSKHIPLTVTECVVNYVLGVSGTAQVGQRLTASFTGLPTKAYEYINYQWYRVTDTEFIPISGANTAVYVPEEADAGYTLACFTYFDIGDPYVYEEGIADIIYEREGIYCKTISSIQEENLTFWQRLVRWIENLIQALTGIMWSFGM